MAIKKFTNQSPDKDLGKNKSDIALAKIGHLNRLVDDLNKLGVSEKLTDTSKVDFKTVGPKVYFEKYDGSHGIDVIIPGVLEITRGNDGGLYNHAVETHYSNGVGGPLNTEWNSRWTAENYNNPANYGWKNLAYVDTRVWGTWKEAMSNSWPPHSVGDELLMRETTTGRIWMIKFHKWAIGDRGGKGGFAYERYEVMPKVIFERPAFRPDVVDIVSPDLIIKRDNYRGIYNAAQEEYFDDYVYNAPKGTLWNSQRIDNRAGFHGWYAIGTVTQRKYDFWPEVVNGMANNLVDKELIMKDLSTGLYYMVKFTNWGVGNEEGGGAFTYERTLIPMDKKVEFSDGTIIDSAASFPTGAIPEFLSWYDAQAAFTSANGYTPGRSYFYVNTTNNTLEVFKTDLS